MHQHPRCFSQRSKVPTQCSWVDQRLVRERDLDQRSHAACPLSLCLVPVADAQGLRFASDHALCQRVAMTAAVFSQARPARMACTVVASQRPLSQVLALDREALRPTAERPTLPLPGDEDPVDLTAVFTQIWEVLSCSMTPVFVRGNPSIRTRGSTRRRAPRP